MSLFFAKFLMERIRNYKVFSSAIKGKNAFFFYPLFFSFRESPGGRREERISCRAGLVPARAGVVTGKLYALWVGRGIW